jgi:hypothetical protein
MDERTLTVGVLQIEATLQKRGGLGGTRKRWGFKGKESERPAGWQRMGRMEAEATEVVVGKMKLIVMTMEARTKVCREEE